MKANKILNSTQIKTLKAIAKTKLAKSYYWTGGTALAYKYLPLRLSEDLDFFSFDLETDENLIIELNRLKHDLDIKKIDFTQHLNRQQFVLNFDKNDKLKLEFVFFPFKNLGKILIDKNLNIKIDSLVDIATNKTLATYQRNEPKDIFDLYCLLDLKKFKLADLIKNVNKKFDVKINQADLEAKILNNIDLLKNIEPLILDFEKFNIKEIKNFFSKQTINYLKTFIW
ncbi:MAG: nucleotidyl transferase AbiEii/AbiGii toxin family protein [Patescibacteria group bacterium]